MKPQFYGKLFLMKGNLSCFLPKSVLTLLYSKKEQQICDGSVLFADVAGFTPLTEALMVLGKEGSEELTRTLNNYFSEMIKIVQEHNGDILRFAGDAMTILFEEDKGDTALNCALKMLEKMNDFKKIQTRAGEFCLEMKIGCSYGSSQVGILRDEKEIDYYAFGEPLDISAEAEHHAKRGELVCHKDVIIPNYLTKENLGENFFKISGSYLHADLKNEKRILPDLDDQLQFLLPRYLIEKADTRAIGEHRGTTVIFLSFSVPKEIGDKTHARICEFYKELKSIVSKYGGFINKLDFGDKGSKALLLFGTPYSLEKKEAMAVRCALEIKDKLKEKYNIKLGITSSHLFSALLGSNERKEFTVMGDGINLSARLMGYAITSSSNEVSTENTIIADENTFKSSNEEAEFLDRKKISVKGKSGLIAIFEPIKIKEEKEAKAKTLYGFEEIQKNLIEWIKSEERKPVLITSEIGGGKSSLADWFFNQTNLREYKSIKIDLHPFSKELFFSLISRIFKKLYPIKSAEDVKNLSSNLPDKLKEFIELVNPYLGYKEVEKPSFKNLSPKDKRDIVFSVFLSLLNKVEKTIIVVDSLSFCDETSLQFLSQYLTQFEKKTLDFIVFSRKEILSSQIVGCFEKKIELPSFSKEIIKQFLEKEFNLKNLTDKVINFFEEKSKGNPQLLYAVFETAQKENLLIEKEGLKFIDEDRLFKTTFPDSLEAIYLKEFDKLPNKEKDFLFSASVLGMNVSVNLLSKITNLSENEIDNFSKELEKKNFLKIDNSGKRKYLQFTDTLLYEAIYNLAPFSLKREIHKKVFEEIYNLEGETKPSVFPYLAHHSERAEDKEMAIKFHRLSARMFSERYDNLSALKHFEYVIKNDEISEEYFKDSFKLLDIYLSLGKFEEFKNLLDKLCQYESKMKTQDIAALYSRISEKNAREGNVKGAEENLLYSLKISEKSNDSYGIARALLNLVGRVYGPTGRYEEGKKCLERLLSLPKFEGDAVFRVVALMNLGSIERHCNNYNNAFKFYINALKISKKNSLIVQQGHIISNIIQFFNQQSLFYKAIKYSQEALCIAKSLQQRDVYSNVLISSGFSSWAIGVLDISISVFKEALISSRNMNLFYLVSLTESFMAVASFDNLFLCQSFSFLKESIKFFQNISCPPESLSSELEFLRLLKFLGDENNFNLTIKKWGGRKKILEESKKYNLPFSLRSIVEDNPLKKINRAEKRKNGSKEKEEFDFIQSFDPDAYFVFWFDCQEEKYLHLWKKEIKSREKFLRWDLKVKWCWAYLSKNLDPPFNSIRLLSKSPGGIFGLRILAILYRQNLEKGNKSKANKIRKRFLDNIYTAKIHSDENIWNCILKDKDIFFAIKGK